MKSYLAENVRCPFLQQRTGLMISMRRSRESYADARPISRASHKSYLSTLNTVHEFSLRGKMLRAIKIRAQGCEAYSCRRRGCADLDREST